MANVFLIYCSFLNEKSVEYINFGCKTSKISENFEDFINLSFEEERIGNPHPYLKILITKRFVAQMQISQREWRDVKLFFTIDSNLLFVDTKDSKVILRLMEHTLRFKKLSENIVELLGLE